jgi:hypothetical protein
LDEIIAVSRWRVKSISFGIIYITMLFFHLGVWTFRIEFGFICGWTEKSLQTGVKLFILVSKFIFCHIFRQVRGFVPRRPLKWYIFILVFNARNYFLSHLRLVPTIVFSIWWINVAIRRVAILRVYG